MNRMGIFWRVLGLHLVLLAALGLIPLIGSCTWFQREEVVMTVDLSSLPPPAPPEESPRDPEDEEPEEALTAATPRPTAVPTATPDPRSTPTPAPEPTSTPRPTATPRPAPTPTPTPKSRLLTAEDIRRRIEQENASSTPVPVATVDPDRIRAELGEGLRGGSSAGTTAGSGRGNGVAIGSVKSELDARLDAAWQKPPGLGAGSNLFVDVSVRVERDGRISATRILKPSGHPALDASVIAALNRVRRVRAFPAEYSGGGETFDYRFQIN